MLFAAHMRRSRARLRMMAERDALTGAPAEPAGRIGDKLRRRIEHLRFDDIGRVTISIGVAEARADDNPASWFRRADASMYRAKAAGRNRVVVEEREFSDPESAVAAEYARAPANH